MKHTLNLEIAGCQKNWFSKYVYHFWMEHGVKTRGEHQHTSMLLTWPVYTKLELKACKIGKGGIYMENKVYFELTTKYTSILNN